MHINFCIYKTETDSENELMVTTGEDWVGGDSYGIWNEQVHSSLFKMDNQQGPTVQHREFCSMLCGSLDGKRVWGRMDTRICMAESLYRPSETITTLLIRYTPMQNKICKKKERKKMESPKS